MRTVEVLGVRVEAGTNNPLVLLHDVDQDRFVPILIGAVEATAIAFAQQGVIPPRPLTHDLMRDLLEATGNRLAAVQITDVDDGVFYAELVLASGVHVSARPSDAIALALRVDAPVQCSEQVLAAAAIPASASAEDQIEQFREFLDHVSPEDFGA